MTQHAPTLAQGRIGEDEALAAFARRDRAYDGRFVVCVTTTMIYCRPSCPARRPRPENVFIATTNDRAEAGGFRPCLRCRPDEAARDATAVAKAVVLLKGAGERVALADLAAAVGYSPDHFARVFRRSTGLTPASYGRALRLERAREALGEGDVTGAIAQAGYGSASRFYDQARGKLGMTPSAWANGGAGVTIRWARVTTTLGPMLVAATDKGICRLSFGENEADLRARFPNAELVEGGAAFADLLARVVSAVEVPGSDHDLPLDVRGTAFQERIWAELRRIPAGETRSYAELAAAAGKPKAVRAAGSANGANSVAVLIPCHRVVRSDGSVGGYAYGGAIKAELLARERETGAR
ncbi:methylated-DNA--[protein]-cysteine S-methyltransferase [Croceicoccus sp. BE223]|uniref:bifunctional transcriptional activator/DNA repair enzyme AdaA n=1 Tax=Croceicoccus sp. BE223 TaxID=2817716 RepID=UPI0028600225|nr:methylated-DNA--[protein]-cysteine S-methyltransferase [Croceicoccus sp. BE223]MDR7104050.1 AraC family transcriptional regulator of adaptative response/methylated-DNA-[protein]-cysteine methyltransferase [Croceicoccus sp. BE223]